MKQKKWNFLSSPIRQISNDRKEYQSSNITPRSHHCNFPHIFLASQIKLRIQIKIWLKGIPRWRRMKLEMRERDNQPDWQWILHQCEKSMVRCHSRWLKCDWTRWCRRRIRLKGISHSDGMSPVRHLCMELSVATSSAQMGNLQHLIHRIRLFCTFSFANSVINARDQLISIYEFFNYLWSIFSVVNT